MVGRVVSTKSLKTAVVYVESVTKHPMYKKTYVLSKKYLVDDPIGVKIGDIVDLVNCKPISKRKSFRITKVLGMSLTEIAEAELKKKAEEVISEVMPETSETSETKKENIKTKDRTGQSSRTIKSKKGGRTGLSK